MTLPLTPSPGSIAAVVAVAVVVAIVVVVVVVHEDGVLGA